MTSCNWLKFVKFTTFRPACAYSILLFAHFWERRSNGCEKPGRRCSFFREREREGDVIENRDNDDEPETITRLAEPRRLRGFLVQRGYGLSIRILGVTFILSKLGTHTEDHTSCTFYDKTYRLQVINL